MADYWWKAKDKINEGVFGAFRHIDEQQSVRRMANDWYLRLYTNRKNYGVQGYTDAISIGGRKIALNVIKAAIDTATSQIATNRPRPMYQTIRGDYKLRKRAEGLTKFINGQFYATKQYIKALKVFIDSCVFGTGFIKVCDIDGEIYTERVFPDEVVVDERDGRYGYPRQLFQHKYVNKDLLAELYPDVTDKIKNAGKSRDNYDYVEGDQCSVIEAWHLPSGKSHDGRHVVSVENCVLMDEEWKRETFPIVPFEWNTDPLSYYGIGAVEELESIQVEINTIAQKIQELMTYATSMVWVQKGSGVGTINNKNWAIREYTGRPPIFQTTSSVSGEYFAHLDRLYSKIFEIMGISQLAAQSLKPAGLDSGAALQVYNDIGSKRFQHTSQRWEQFHIDVAEQMIETARDISERGDGDLKVLCQGDKEVEEIKFSEVSIEKNKYSARVWPTNLLPDTPAGKVDMIQRLVQAVPTLAPHMVSLLTGVPDIESVASLETAPLEIAQNMVDGILYEGRMEHPYPEMDLALTRSVATKSILKAYNDGVPEENINMLRAFLDEVDTIASGLQTPVLPPNIQEQQTQTPEEAIGMVPPPAPV